MLNLGVSFAGITVKVPILFEDDIPDFSDEEENRFWDTGIFMAGILILYFGSTYSIKHIIDRRKKNKA